MCWVCAWEGGWRQMLTKEWCGASGLQAKKTHLQAAGVAAC